jgi:multiple antibiotic resistance protein
MDWHKVLFDLITLTVTVDPLGTLPLFLALTKRMTPGERKAAAIRASIIAFIILACFLYAGQYLLEAMRIELPAFQIAGGIVLFLFALSMIFERGSNATQDPEQGHDVAIFPLAMPSIATPGALLAVVVLTDNTKTNFIQETITCGVLLLVLSANLLLMLLGNRVVAIMGRSGLNVVSRVMGMILAAAAVQMVYAALRGEIGHG